MSVRKTTCPVCGKLIPIRKLHQQAHSATHKKPRQRKERR